MKIKVYPVTVLGMSLIRWELESCTADFGVDEEKKWATLYNIESEEKGKGHATKLLKIAKKYYEDKGFKFGSSVALNDGMGRILKKLKIKEYA
jgi:hypothetical protein